MNRKVFNKSASVNSWEDALKLAKGRTVDSLLEQARDEMSTRYDYRVSSPKGDYTPALGVKEDGEDVRYAAKVKDVAKFIGNQVMIGLPSDGLSLFNLEDNAFNQMGRKLGTPFFGRDEDTGKMSRNGLPRDYFVQMGKVNPALYEQMMNYHLDLYPNGGYIRTHGDTVTAWMGSDYQRFDADDMLTTLKDIVDAGKITRCAPLQANIWRDGMDVSFLTYLKDGSEGKDAGDDSPYAAGFTLTTGHTGNIAVGILPFVMRGRCINTARYEYTREIKFKHNGNRVARMNSMYTMIMDCVHMTEELYQNILKSRFVALPNLEEVARKFTDDNGLTDSFFADMMQGCEKSQTVWGLANGITWAAQDEKVDNETRIKLETVAGSVVDEDLRPEWLRKAIAQAERQRQYVGVEVR